jgi:RNA polymerase sigma factor (sigma-70 family)
MHASGESKENALLRDRKGMVVMVEDEAVAQLEALYEERFDQFVRVASGITGGIEDGIDAVHSAFLACLSTRDAYRGLGTLEAWVWRAVVTSALKRVRSRRRESGVNVDEMRVHEHGASHDPLESDVNVEDVRSAVKALPERQRVVLFLRYYADLDYRTIARVLEIRPGTVGAALNKAQLTLRRALDDGRGER